VRESPGHAALHGDGSRACKKAWFAE